MLTLRSSSALGLAGAFSIASIACTSSSPLVAPPCAAPHASASAAPIAPIAPSSAPSNAETPNTDDTPALAQVIDEAKRANKPIFVEMSATGCVPCHDLEKGALSDPSVIAAIGAYRAQRYDAMVGNGVDAAEKLSVNEFPTLLVLAPDGTEIARVDDRDAAPLAATLKKLAPIAAKGALDSARMANETDAYTLYLGARVAQNSSDRDAAEALFIRARDAADAAKDATVGTAARFALLRWDARRDDLRRHRAMILAFADRYPSSTDAITAKAQTADVTDDAHLAITANDPLAFPAPPARSGMMGAAPPPEMMALMQLEKRISSDIVAKCSSAPRTMEQTQEMVRLAIDGGHVTRALLLDPEAAPAFKSCIEGIAQSTADIPSDFGAHFVLSVVFAVK
jgi:hypothetical protein